MLCRCKSHEITLIFNFKEWKEHRMIHTDFFPCWVFSPFCLWPTFWHVFFHVKKHKKTTLLCPKNNTFWNGTHFGKFCFFLPCVFHSKVNSTQKIKKKLMAQATCRDSCGFLYGKTFFFDILNYTQKKLKTKKNIYGIFFLFILFYGPINSIEGRGYRASINHIDVLT